MSGIETDAKRPPGPGGLATLRLLQSMSRNPLAGMLQLHRTHGRAARIGGPMPQNLFFRPEAAEHVLVTHNKRYRKGVLNAQFKVLDGLGLVTSEGDLWVRQRRMVQPAFHRQKLAALGSVMAEEAARAADRWVAHAADGRPFDVVPELMRLTLQSASRTLFGVDLEHEAQKVGPAVDDARAYLTWRMSRPFVPPWVPTRLGRRFLRARRLLDELVYGLISARRREGTAGRADLLSMFVEAVDAESGARMDDRQVRDEVMTLLMAGHESTAVTLSWVLFLLGRHPAEQARVAEEVDRVVGGRAPAAEDVGRLPYVRMVIDEAMRLYPPVWAMSRQAAEDDVVDGFRVARGEHVTLVQYAVHRLPDIWDEPDAFRPERFTPEAVEARPRYAYFPFGAGPRGCIGNHFALMEAALVLATVAQRFQVRAAADQKVEVELDPQISLRMKGGTWISLERRAARPGGGLLSSNG
jgi:cytochrome P450